MAATTGIAWTDSTFNSWHGCTKVSEWACAHCYAEAVDKRGGGDHWGHGAPRRLLSEHARNEPYRWQRKADEFYAEHGRDRRVFTLSMGDLFDNEVDPQWRADHMAVMEACDRLQWQVCTKRISNLPKMVPPQWHPHIGPNWPQHIGTLITTVTQAEADRDIPRLVECKKRFGIPWVGISYEPAMERIDFAPWVADLDWIIFGGESGAGWRSFDGFFDAARSVRDQCAAAGTAFFFKQVAAFRPTDAMIPDDLRIRQWPEPTARFAPPSTEPENA